MSLNDIFRFANLKNVNLSNDEAIFILNFIKKNWLTLLKNQDISIIDKYKDNFSDDNYFKIKTTLIEYKNKYGKMFR